MKYLLALVLMIAMAAPAMAQKGTADSDQLTENLRWLERYAIDRRQYFLDTEAGLSDPVWLAPNGIVTIADRDGVVESFKFAYLMWAMTGDNRILQNSIPAWLLDAIDPSNVRHALMGGWTDAIDRDLRDAIADHSDQVRSQVIGSLDHNIAAIQNRLSGEGQGTPFALPDVNNGIDGWGASAEGASYLENEEGIEFRPPSDGVIDYFEAPPRFHGDWRGARSLVFDKRSEHGTYTGATDYPGGYGDVEIYNGEMRAVIDIAQHHTGQWRTFAIPLNEGAGWRFGGGAQQLSDVLSNVTRFRIRAEYGAGDDISAIRNIHLE